VEQKYIQKLGYSEHFDERGKRDDESLDSQNKYLYFLILNYTMEALPIDSGIISSRSRTFFDAAVMQKDRIERRFRQTTNSSSHRSHEPNGP
jgi:hypothetical protein